MTGARRASQNGKKRIEAAAEEQQGTLRFEECPKRIQLGPWALSPGLWDR